MYSQYEIIDMYETPFRYFAAQSEPGSGWYLPGYDDSSWSLDTGRIGYGDDSYEIIVSDQTRALYLRYEFDLPDKDAFKIMNFQADFDDGYIAYLNGKEIIRVNIDKNIKTPSFNDLTIRSHEPEYSSTAVLGYYIDSTILDTCLVNGINTIAVQVLNDSINGSDLHFRLDVHDFTNTNDYNIYDPDCRYKRQCDLDSTKLPVVIIETDEFGIPVKRIERMAHMGIISGTEGTYNKPSDSCNVYYGPVEIEVRGESSASFPKRSYDFDLRDEFGNDTNVALLGMPRESDWVLFGPWADKSQFRNPLIYYLSSLTGQWAPRTRFCEVVINGEYVGLYTIVEKIKRDANRVDIARLNPDEISGTDLTGGYIFKHDKPNSSVIQISYPNGSDLQPQQEAYIKGYYDEYKSVLKSNGGLDPVTGYKTYIDESTLIDYVVISEFAKNCDAYAMSSYMYKDRDDNDARIKFGPVWDFDLAFGNSPWQEGFRYDIWQFDDYTNRWFDIQRLFEDPALVDRFEDRWFELRESFLATDYVMDLIDSFVVALADPIERNYRAWPVIDKYVFQPSWPYNVASYEEEIDYFKGWLNERVTWVDENITALYYPVTEYPSAIDEQQTGPGTAVMKAYPNPFRKELRLNIYVPVDGDLQISIFNVNGQVADLFFEGYMREGYYNLFWSDEHRLPEGIYLLNVMLDEQPVGRIKLVKIR
ncbi:MAG: CotH kinase family protein [Bacteroidales bacterium]